MCDAVVWNYRLENTAGALMLSNIRAVPTGKSLNLIINPLLYKILLQENVGHCFSTISICKRMLLIAPLQYPFAMKCWPLNHYKYPFARKLLQYNIHLLENIGHCFNTTFICERMLAIPSVQYSFVRECLPLLQYNIHL